MISSLRLGLEHPSIPVTYTECISVIVKDAGLPDIKLHDLRHTAASLMLNHGIPVLIVAKRLGHANQASRSTSVDTLNSKHAGGSCCAGNR